MAKPSISPYVFAILVAAAVLGIYLPGIKNDLLFDDLRLTDGTIFEQYGSLLQFKQRMLSYGSFVWIEALAGSGWWKQRIVNIALHMGVVAAVYALLKQLLTHTAFPTDFEQQPHFGASRTAALRVGVALFAVSPVAVYAVAYLIQRSILAATLLAVLACWLFVRGLLTKQIHWYALALLSYIAALLAKEYAVMTVAMTIPLFIFIRRPPWKTVALTTGFSLAILGLVAGIFLTVYGAVLGKIFDPRSIALVQQLEVLHPGITQHVYALSILNEAALFFIYGLLWVFPNVQWMSIDMRPPFPLSFMSMPHILGGLAYVALLCAAVWLVLRKSGVLGLAGLLLLFPLLWYATEFVTVWVQDPLVLYRSYLWAIAIPGLLAIGLTGLKPRTIYTIGIVLGLLSTGLALERVLSLRDELSAWGDAAEKVDIKGPLNAVGRSRPYLNLGAYHLEKGSLAEAENAFATAHALGDLGGNALFNIGMALQQQKKHAQALTAFQNAEANGFKGQALQYHRGESAFALGQFELAYISFSAGLTEPLANTREARQMQQTLLLRRAEAAIGAKHYSTAIEDFQLLLQANPNSGRLKMGLGMALIGKGDAAAAIALFDTLLASSPSAAAYYGRGMAYHRAGDRAASLKDLDQAIRLDPRNPQYAQVRMQVASGSR